MPDEQIRGLITKSSTEVSKDKNPKHLLHLLDMEAADSGGATVVSLLRSVLHLNACAELSDPRCYLSTVAPGEIVNFNETCHTELRMFDKTVKKAGKGDKVRLVFPGLYFKHPHDTVEPNCKCMVVRVDNGGLKSPPLSRDNSVSVAVEPPPAPTGHSDGASRTDGEGVNAK